MTWIFFVASAALSTTSNVVWVAGCRRGRRRRAGGRRGHHHRRRQRRLRCRRWVLEVAALSRLGVQQGEGHDLVAQVLDFGFTCSLWDIPLRNLFTFASPGDAPGFNCSWQAVRLVNSSGQLFQWSVIRYR